MAERVLTVVTPTIGRETLYALVDSAEGTDWQPGDQWIVVGDTLPRPHPAPSLPAWVGDFVGSLGHPFQWTTHEDPASCAGNAQRNHAIDLASRGNYLVWMDDNDRLTPGALNVIRSELPSVPGPVQFDVTWVGVRRGLSDIPTFPMTFPNEHNAPMEAAGGGQQFVTPNLPAKVPRWGVSLGSSDYDFVRDTLLLWGGPGALKQVDYLIAHTT